MRVKIRGQVFNTVKEAAKAHGVSTTTVYKALDNGREDWIGIGTGRTKYERNCGVPKRPVRLFGREWVSVSAAARAIGCDRKTITNALDGSDAARRTILKALMTK